MCVHTYIFYLRALKLQKFEIHLLMSSPVKLYRKTLFSIKFLTLFFATDHFTNETLPLYIEFYIEH